MNQAKDKIQEGLDSATHHTSPDKPQEGKPATDAGVEQAKDSMGDKAEKSKDTLLSKAEKALGDGSLGDKAKKVASSFGVGEK